MTNNPALIEHTVASTATADRIDVTCTHDQIVIEAVEIDHRGELLNACMATFAPADIDRLIETLTRAKSLYA